MSSTQRLALLFLAVGLVAGPNVADAQVSVTVSRGYPPPNVYVQPVQPQGEVYVQPVQEQQPPPVVYVQPPQPQRPEPPVVYVQPQQQVIQQPVIQQPVIHHQQVVQPIVQVPQQAYRAPRNPRVGFHVTGGAVLGQDTSMGGLNYALRLRPRDRFAFDIGSGVWGGGDYNGRSRVEIPLMVDALVFFNPQSRVQFYGLVGFGTSFALLDSTWTSDLGSGWSSGTTRERSTYLGAQAGIGLEFRLGQHFALNTDVRGTIRGRVNSTEAGPEFRHADGRTSNTSIFATWNFGGTIYF